MKIEIRCLGDMCARCEKLELTELRDIDDDYHFKGWACQNMGQCMWIVDEYNKERTENIRKAGVAGK